MAEKSTDEELVNAKTAESEKTVEHGSGDLSPKKVRFEGEIRERVEVPADTQLSTEEWETTFDSIPDLILLIDTGSRIVKANKAACDKLGFKREDLVGQLCYKVLHGSDEPPAHCPHVLLKSTGQPQTAEYYEPHLDAYYRFSATPLYNEANQMVGVAEVAHDITEQKQIEEKLQQGRDLLNATGKMAKVGGWEFIVETLEIKWTDEVYNIHEVELSYQPTMEQAIDFYVPQSRPVIRQAVQKAIDDGEPFDLELQLITAKGNRIWVHAMGHAILKNGKAYKVAGTFQDITKEKEAKEKLKNLAKSQSVLLREVNHRVTNNLSAIISMLHIEERRAARAGTPELPVINEIVSRIKGLATVHRMLSRGGWRPLDLAQLSEKIIRGVFKGLPLAQEYDLNVKSAEPIQVSSDQAHHLTLVFGELATNCIKHGQGTGDRLLVHVALEKDGRRVNITIQDNGPGYPGELLAGDRSREGAGLELIRGIVNHSLEGEVRLENNSGARTIIVFDLEENSLDKEIG